jgi:hypothetical protein
MKPKNPLDNSMQKRKYAAPLLTRYGALKDLTQSGTGTTQERTKNDGSCGGSLKRRPCASDRDVKQNIVRIGDHPLGIGLYLFDYKPGFRDQWGHGRQFGVMAQEVEAVMPRAVSTNLDGYKMVDYGMLGIQHEARQTRGGAVNLPNPPISG